MNKKMLFPEFLRYLLMVFTFAFMSYGLTAMLWAGVGAPPWDVLHLGLSLQTGLSYGRVAQGVGLVLILVSWILRVKPYLGTILNMFFIGFFVDLFMAAGLAPRPAYPALQVIQLALGTALFSYGTAAYILINRGTGPRDSFMLALSRITKLRIGLIRTFIEIAATVGGYLLGGPLGLGTILFALSVGPLIEFFFKIGRKQAEAVKALLNKRAKPGMTRQPDPSR